VIGYPQGPIFLSLVVAFFTVVTTGHRLAAILGLAAGYFGFLWLRYLLDREPAPSLGAILGLAAWLLVLFSAAEFVRVRRERALEAAGFGRSRHAAGPARSACGWPASCTTRLATTSR
jgi:hypothetical protein